MECIRAGSSSCRVGRDVGFTGVCKGCRRWDAKRECARPVAVGVLKVECQACVYGRIERRASVSVGAFPSSSSSSSPSTAAAATSGGGRPRHHPSPHPRPNLRPHVVIIVEGINDARNVNRYLDVDMYVLGSATKTATPRTQEALRGLQAKYRRIVLLLDPDVAGRQARNDIDRLLNGNKVRCRLLCSAWRGLTLTACFFASL